ncbi:hypothetical protein EVAR_99437_1 [Eumeta japonica]|uniref:Uncharacterized protein n=1 Tax=Eumeta variegata TaxID=151549 RepID=A0A4C1ZBW9_EUMVA|nr:hypothetical protein EVAR_99437_1 [Eumeta japonica]
MTSLPCHQYPSIRYPITIREAGNALVTAQGLQVSMGGDDCHSLTARLLGSTYGFSFLFKDSAVKMQPFLHFDIDTRSTENARPENTLRTYGYGAAAASLRPRPPPVGPYKYAISSTARPI